MSDTYDPTNPHRPFDPDAEQGPNYGTPQRPPYAGEQPSRPVDPVAQQRLAEAVSETAATHHRQEQGRVQEPEPPAQRIGRRTDALRSALSTYERKDSVLLPELSRRSTEGPIRLKARRLVLQELAASNMLPVRADALVSKLLDQALAVTEAGRREWGVENPLSREDVDDVVEDLYGGWNREAVAAFLEFQCIVCCLAVIDPDYKLVMTWDDVEKDPKRNVLVWSLPEEDRTAIYEWVMAREAEAEATVTPFR